MRKRLFLLVALVAVGLQMLFANGVAEQSSPQKGKKEGPVEISFWALESRQKGIQLAADAFNGSQNKVHVTCSFYSTDGMKDACKVAASSKTLPNCWFNWGGALGGFYSDNGLCYDLTDFAKKRGWDKQFTSASLGLCTRNGVLWGYPQSFNVLGIYYRKDIFEKYQIQVPTTFEEFEDACAKLKANGIIPITTAGKYGWHVMRFVELLIEHYAGADMHDQMNLFKAPYDNDAVIKALAKYKEFVDKGYFPDGFLTIDPNDTKLLLYSGKAAMDVQGQWYDSNILTDDQDLSLYGVFAFPSGGTNRFSSFAEMTQFNASNTEAEMDACADWMDFLYSDAMVSQNGKYYKLPLPHKNVELPKDRPNVIALINAAEKNGTFTITDQAFPTQVADALFAAQDAIASGQMTPEEGAKNIQNAIEQYLAQ